MKKLLLLLAILMVVMTCHSEEVSKSFIGVVSSVVVNGKHFRNIERQTFVLRQSSTSKGVIAGDISKIGKMPGTLHFEIPVNIGHDGSLSTPNGKKVGEMHFPLGMTKKLCNKSMKGIVTVSGISFSLHIVSTVLGIKMADASFSFQSK